MSPGFCGQSAYLTDAEAWKHFVETHDHSLLKAPLSGSGKGLNRCRGVFSSLCVGLVCASGAYAGWGSGRTGV